MNRSRRNKSAPAWVVGVFCFAAAALTACTGGQRLNVLVPDGSPSLVVMDFRKPLTLDPLPDGWHHRTFFRTDPMQISFVSKEGRPSIRLATHHSGSMLYRFTDLPLDQYPMLRWDWFVEQPIASEIDETTKAGDDHPARLYLKFRSANGETHAMEIIWGNRKLRAAALFPTMWRAAAMRMPDAGTTNGSICGRCIARIGAIRVARTSRK